MPISTDPNAPMAGASVQPVSEWDKIKAQFQAHYESSEPQKYHLALHALGMIQSGIAELARMGHTWIATETWNNKAEYDKQSKANEAKAQSEADAKAKAAAVKAQADADAKAAADKKAADDAAKAATAAAKSGASAGAGGKNA